MKVYKSVTLPAILVFMMNAIPVWADEDPLKEEATSRKYATGAAMYLLSNGMIYGIGSMENGANWNGALFSLCSLMVLNTKEPPKNNTQIAALITASAGFAALAAYNFSSSDKEPKDVARNTVIGFNAVALTYSLIWWMGDTPKEPEPISYRPSAAASFSPSAFTRNGATYLGFRYSF